MTETTYTGRVYVRPAGRGVDLVDLGYQDVAEWIAEALGEDPYAGGCSGDTRIRITLEVQPDEQEDHHDA